MLHITGSVKDIQAVACSGGVDSMVALDFLRRGNPNIKAVYFNHSTKHGNVAHYFVRQYCVEKGIELISANPPPQIRLANESLEEHWRNIRYEFFHGLGITIATAHHLNDVAETMIFQFANGTPRGIPYRNKNVVRPFLTTTKAEILDWAERHNVPYIDDPSNNNLQFSRNRIRATILPEILKVNPGFLRVVRRQVKEYTRDHLL